MCSGPDPEIAPITSHTLGQWSLSHRAPAEAKEYGRCRVQLSTMCPTMVPCSEGREQISCLCLTLLGTSTAWCSPGFWPMNRVLSPAYWISYNTSLSVPTSKFCPYLCLSPPLHALVPVALWASRPLLVQFLAYLGKE